MRLQTVLLILWSVQALGATPALTTTAEESGWKRTGHYEEAAKLCEDFATNFPKEARCVSFGRSPEGRKLLALVVGTRGSEKQRPVVMFQGGIHAGEIDGKDAGFLLVREILTGKILPGALAKVTLVFVPIFNVDGHERFGKNNRPNQVGPEEMGWRTNAQNLNLNRDYLKVETPEMAGMLRLLEEWDPILYVDLHVTDGAQFASDVAIPIQPVEGGPEALRAAGRRLRDDLMTKLKSEGHLPVPFYPDFMKEDDPSSGFSADVAEPRFSHGYWQWRNRIGVLVETHSWKDYATRVKATHDVLAALIENTMREGASWRKVAARADKEAGEIGGRNVMLDWKATDKSRPMEFAGYAYRREPSAISGAMKIVYDTKKPETWKIPFHYELASRLTVRAPREGYIVPAAHAAWLGEKLKLHGVVYETWNEPRKAIAVETYRAKETTFANTIFEGRLRLSVTGEWKPEKRDVPAGSLFVPIAQPGGRLVMQALEPEAPDSFLAWGFFNAAFERKEYMEGYLAEDVAAAMLAREPGLRREFSDKLESDPDFARDPKRRLEFFYRRHPSWDERFGLYPVYRLEKK